MMNLILAVGRSMKRIMTLILCLMTLKKILGINYTYGSLTQPMAKEILWRVSILFIYQRMDERRGVILIKNKMIRRKKYLEK